MKQAAAYGTWPSVVTAEFVAGKERQLTPNLWVDGEDIYFTEARPDEKGRSVLMCRHNSGRVTEVLPPEFNLRTRYLEYGGRSFTVHQGTVYFVNFADQQIWVKEAGATPRQLTNEKNHRFADITVDTYRQRLIVLREVQQAPESLNSICTVDLKNGVVTDLVSGEDFYNSPRLSPDGRQLLWTSWCHPNMAWNGTKLWLASLDEHGTLGPAQKIAGDQNHAVCQARWSADGVPHFVAELDDWLNLYAYRNGKVENLFPRESEFAFPDWTPGTQNYAFGSDGSIGAIYLQKGRCHWVKLRAKQNPQHLEESFSVLHTVQAYRNGFVALAGYATHGYRIIFMDAENRVSVLHAPEETRLDAAHISVPEQVEFPTEEGGIGYAFYYPPTHKDFTGRPGEKAPLIVKCHGGPTAMAFGEFNKGILFWTNRGYAVVDVNYGGSTGYGRKYRERLRGRWGLVDVSDCAAVVRQLVREGKVDPARVAIRGGSAGGYTTLAALAFTEGVFSVGASYFGVSELEMLAKETHKLESRYLDQLVGPYPEALAVYKERAPIEHVNRLNCPIIFFQGDEDKIVPPNQSELMHESLKKKGIPTEYHLYAGEGHGFRNGENIQHSLKAEHNFYAKRFSFAVRDDDRV